MTPSRDARHLALPQICAEGQQRIAQGKVLCAQAHIGELKADVASSAPVLRLHDGVASDFRSLGVSKCRDCQACGA